MKGTPSISKLKSLIEAIDLMSEEEEWVPTAKQWKRIREIIEALDDEPQPQPQAQPAPRYETHQATESSLTKPPEASNPPRGPNPWATGAARMPEVPSAIPAEAATLAPSQSSLLAATVAKPQQPQVPSGNDAGKPPPMVEP